MHGVEGKRSQVLVQSYLGCCSRIRIHTGKIVERDHEKKVVPIYDVKGEDKRVLGVVEKWDDIDVHDTGHHTYPCQH